MLQEILVQFKENFNQKVKTPFFGAFIIVWSVRHWELLYSLFNFDKDCTREDKIEVIKNLFGNRSFEDDLGICLWMTFASLIVSYLLISVSRYITVFFEKYVTPTIYKFGDQSKVVTREDFNKEQRSSEAYKNKYEQERKLRLAIEAERDSLEKRLTGYENKTNSMWVGETPQLSPKEEFNILFFNRLKNKNQLEELEASLEKIIHGSYIVTSDLGKDLYKNGLILHTGKYSKTGSDLVYIATDKGKSFIDYYNIQKLKS